jgi:hypothetical protein
LKKSSNALPATRESAAVAGAIRLVVRREIVDSPRVSKRPSPKKSTAARKRPAMPAIAIGQMWKLENGHLQITGMGRLLASYKVFRVPGQKGVQTQMSGIEGLQKYLRTNKAGLMHAAKAA